MKKIIVILIVCLMLLFSVGCSNEVNIDKELHSTTSMFVIVEVTDAWKVAYHKETKVMYVISSGYYNHGTFTLMVDQAGKPLLWQGE